jgi:hypothetical protein
MAGLAVRADLRVGPALDVLPTWEDTFDIISLERYYC